MTTDDLLQPTITNDERPGPRPWRVSSQFWVAFFGGALACGIIAMINARRLGLARQKVWIMAALTAATVAVLLAFWMQRPATATFGIFIRDARDMRIYARVAAVVLYLALAAIQRPADARHQVFSGGQYASLWAAGLGATILAGSAQPLLLAAIAWSAR